MISVAICNAKMYDQLRSPTIIVRAYELVWSQFWSGSMWRILNLITFDHRRTPRLIKLNYLDLKCYQYLITFDHLVNLDPLTSLISVSIIALKHTPDLLRSSVFIVWTSSISLTIWNAKRSDQLWSRTIIVRVYELVGSQFWSGSMWRILNLITFDHRWTHRLIKSNYLDLKCYHYLITFDHRVNLDPLTSLISVSVIALKHTPEHLRWTISIVWTSLISVAICNAKGYDQFRSPTIIVRVYELVWSQF